MTRGATRALLPEPIDDQGHRSRHPQPVLDTLSPSTAPNGAYHTLPSHSSTPAMNGTHDHHRPNISHSRTHSITGRDGAESDGSDEDAGLQMAAPAHSKRIGATSDTSTVRPTTLLRAQTDVTGRNTPQHQRPRSLRDGPAQGDSPSKERFQIRHGWEAQLDSPERANQLSQNFFMYFEDKRHDTAGNPVPRSGFPLEEDGARPLVSEWRMKDRLKTVSAVLGICLNIGVDPPDVIKTDPCARLECWVDPVPPENTTQPSSSNSNSQIGKNLQSQYENLSLRTRYKVIVDPTVEELKRYATNLRRSAHTERILFHYNGHGVPKPTQSGEVWAFNRSYTQYIPISLYDIQEWIGAPGLWVWDCSAAGGIITGFMEAVAKHNANQQEALRRDMGRTQSQPQAQITDGQQQSQAAPPSPVVRWDDSIHLAACRDNEVLPTNPHLPADIFTSCLTTPIAMAVRFFLLQNPLPQSSTGITLEQARNIPGKVSERRTPLGELNWIFTAITDTIAWNCLEKPLFKKLFRQDLMVAALFRNFLLAQRVMRIYHCHPQSHPIIPDTHTHPLWRSWDLAVEMILAQLPRLLEQQKAYELAVEAHAQNAGPGAAAGAPGAPPPPAPPELEYHHSEFFADQLSAFEVYLTSAPGGRSASDHPKAPEQLPIVLQVLLSQVHRLRALKLLARFLDLGPWAVELALSIGIFPYVLKLLQSQAIELKPPMIFIWSRILAVDQTCQVDLLKDSGFTYFTNILMSPNNIVPVAEENSADHRAMCAFVISMFCKDFRQGQAAVLEACPDIMESCLNHLRDMENPLLRQMCCLCLMHLWKDFPMAKTKAFACQAHARVMDRSHDAVPEVRAACLVALSTFVGTGDGSTIPDAGVVLEEETLASVIVAMGMDGSIMVRKELTVFYSTFMKKYEPRFLVAAWEQLIEEKEKASGSVVKDDDNDDEDEDRSTTNGPPNGQHRRSTSLSATPDTGTLARVVSKSTRLLSKKTIYRAVWRQILSMSADPHPEVARNAGIVVDYIINALLASPLGDYAQQLLVEMVTEGQKRDHSALTNGDALNRQRSRDPRPQTPPSPSSSVQKADGYFGLSRTASVAAAMKNLVGWGGRHGPDGTPPSPGGRAHAGSTGSAQTAYRSRPLTPGDAALLPPDALDNIVGPPHQPPAKLPATPYFVERNLNQPLNIPLKSSFFAWSSTYFREVQMRPSENDEPGSLNYNERLWRRNRNDKIILSTQGLKEAAGSQRWDVPCGYFGIGAAPAKMVFHQFENHLVTSDDRDSIAVWDWQQATQLCRFSNGNPAGSRVTELRFINEDDQAMLMTGSSDGVIKIFCNYDDVKKVQLASSFRALSDLVVSDQRNAGLVFDWQQGQGRILVAGDDRVIRIWQASQELCIADIPARSGSCITSLTSDQVEGNVFVAGFGNGSVRVYDQRMSARDSMIMDWTNRNTDHRSWIVGAHLQRGGTRELVTAESSGGIRLWDIRMRRAVNGIDGKKEARNLRSLSVHEHAPVFATGGSDHTIRVYNMQLRQLSSFEPYMSYLRLANTPRHAPITSTAFHPHRMMLACGAVNDGHVNLFKCEASSANAGKATGAGLSAESSFASAGTVEEWRA